MDLELALAVDLFDLVDPRQAGVSRSAHVAALRGPAFATTVRNGALGAVALTYIEWSDAGITQGAVPWSLIASHADAARFADALDAGAPMYGWRTGLGAALLTAAALIESDRYDGERRVIDLSANGPANDRPAASLARDRVVAWGMTIIGLPTLTDLVSGHAPFDMTDGWNLLHRYSRDCVIGGPGAFSAPVRTAADLTAVVLRELTLEMAGPVWPGTTRPPPRLARAC